jgi:hypothetical protein
MQISITEWALQSYLDLVHSGTLPRDEYKDVVRPDVEKLKVYPADVAFGNSKFWGPATDRAGNSVPDGYKMKWHNMGPGKVQLRLCVALLGSDAFLCQAYVKQSDPQDKREAAKLKTHIQNIRLGNYTKRGVLP